MRALAFAGLATANTGTRRARFAHKALDASLDYWREETHEFIRSLSSDDGEAILEVAAYLSPTRRETALVEVIELLGQSRSRRRVLAMLARVIAEEPATSSLAAWLRALKASSRQGRADVLLDIATLTPLLKDIGDPEAACMSLRALDLAVQWWP
jgi:hypothetical protein